MDEAAFVEQIKDTYERIEHLWISDYHADDVTIIGLYITAYRKVIANPFAVPFVHNSVVAFLESKLDEAMDGFPLERFGEVFDFVESRS